MLNCAAGLEVCDNSCVDTETNYFHCGDCGTVCPAGHRCDGGECILECPSGLTNCGGECLDLDTNHEACGSCESACLAGQVCSGGSCQTSCASGLTNCSGSCVDRNSSNAHCGACGNACVNGAACLNGSCVAIPPTGFNVGNPNVGTRRGGDGGQDFTRSCRDLGADYALVGWSIARGTERYFRAFPPGWACRNGDRVIRLVPRCARLQIKWTGLRFLIGTGSVTNLGAVGSTHCQTDSGTQYCPADQVVVGIHGRYGAEVDALGIHCGYIELSGTPGNWSVNRGPISHSSSAMGGGGGGTFDLTCSSGRIGTRIGDRANDRIDRIRLDCSLVSVTNL